MANGQNARDGTRGRTQIANWMWLYNVYKRPNVMVHLKRTQNARPDPPQVRAEHKPGARAWSSARRRCGRGDSDSPERYEDGSAMCSGGCFRRGAGAPECAPVLFVCDKDVRALNTLEIHKHMHCFRRPLLVKT